MQYRLKISLFIFISTLAILPSCQKKKICAAYNSYFVFKEENIAPMFVPFGSDSMPPEKDANKFDNFGAIRKNGTRNDKLLLKYKFKDFKEGEIKPVDSTMLANGDSLGSIISIKDLFPEKVNTDQEAYNHYMKELNKNFGEQKKKTTSNSNKPSEVEEFDSTVYYNNPPEMLTKEEKAQWKKDKKAYKKRKKAKEKARKEGAAKKEEEGEEEEFDFDLEEE